TTFLPNTFLAFLLLTSPASMPSLISIYLAVLAFNLLYSLLFLVVFSLGKPFSATYLISTIFFFNNDDPAFEPSSLCVLLSGSKFSTALLDSFANSEPVCIVEFK